MSGSRATDSRSCPSIRATPRNSILAFASIVAVSIVAYLPAIDNFFISDDFDLFGTIEAAKTNPRWFFESTTEFFRLVSYIYFGVCYWLFGLRSQPYYWAGIALHAIVSVLVYLLVKDLTDSTLSGWAAGLFFAAYERHQEAIMWISAANETILALNCLVFLLLWYRASERRSAICLVLAHVMFVVALFSKEAGVIMVPIAALQLLLAGHSLRTVMRKSIVLTVMAGSFVLLWLAVERRNPFVTLGYYAFRPQFISVYLRSFARLAAQLAPLGAAWLITRYCRFPRDASDLAPSILKSNPATRKSATIFFSAFLMLAVAPYSFLTYQNHIPSRHTYLASIGLAGLVGILAAALYARMTTEWSRRLGIMSFCTLLIGNISYLWLKKDLQFQQRAAPTRELIAVLNADNKPHLPVHVCQFPLDPSVFNQTVKRFTPFDANMVMLADDCKDVEGTTIRWDENTSNYRTSSGDSPAD